MTDFLNYKVQLFLKDGSVSSGKITSVDGSHIILSDVSLSNQPGQTLPSIEIGNSSIADLKVTDLPVDWMEKYKNKKKKKEDSKARKSKKESPVSVTPDNSNTSMSQDFDFAANLAMFDKKSVFEDFQKKDTVKPEHRLVGHNKVDSARKPTDKFRNDEMVLQDKTDDWDAIGNPVRTDRNASVTGRSTPVPGTPAGASKNYSLFNNSTGNQVPVCSPIQLLDIERIASEHFKYASNSMAEVFASHISQYITKLILGGSSRLNYKNHNLPPLVLLLIGSERCSSRAFAVGRHLTNHGVRVLAYIVNQDMSDSTYLHQKELFQESGGKILTGAISELWHVLNHQLSTPVELVIDALQGYDDHLEDVFYEQAEQEVVKELIAWCNEPHQVAKVMSLDIPSGIDGGSGTITVPQLVIKSKWCVSMGLPVAGILHAYRNEYLKLDEETETVHLLVDIGVPNKVYLHKSNLRRFDKVWYGAESVVKLNLVEKA